MSDGSIDQIIPDLAIPPDLEKAEVRVVNEFVIKIIEVHDGKNFRTCGVLGNTNFEGKFYGTVYTNAVVAQAGGAARDSKGKLSTDQNLSMAIHLWRGPLKFTLDSDLMSTSEMDENLRELLAKEGYRDTYPNNEDADDDKTQK